MHSRILVTGGAGYIGSILVERLIQRGYHVVILDNLTTGHKAAINPQAQFVLSDVCNRACLDLIFSNFHVEAVIHMAGKALIPESISDPAPFYKVNLMGGMALVDAMVSYGVKKIVFSSTAAVYGTPLHLPIEEDHPTNPINSYGETKLGYERLLKWYANAYGLEVTVFRYFSAAGASEVYGEAHIPETHLLPRMLQAAIGGEPAQIYGDDYDTPDGSCIRDFIHVSDLADAHIQALEILGSDNYQTFNLGSGSGFSVKQVIDIVEEITGKSVKRVITPRREGDPARLVASAEKAKQILNWQPQYPSLNAIIESAWQWHLKHPNGYME